MYSRHVCTYIVLPHVFGYHPMKRVDENPFRSSSTALLYHYPKCSSGAWAQNVRENDLAMLPWYCVEAPEDYVGGCYFRAMCVIGAIVAMDHRQYDQS